MTDWDALAIVALTGVCLLTSLGLVIGALVVLPALKMVDELTGLMEDE